MADLPYTTTADHLLRKVYIVGVLASRSYLLSDLAQRNLRFDPLMMVYGAMEKKKDSYLKDLTCIRGGPERGFLWGSSILVVDFDPCLYSSANDDLR